MKIYFCDGCNESVPLADVQAGQVTTIKGKLFCQNCIPQRAVATPAPAVAAAPARTHPLVVLLLVALLGWTVWQERALFLESGPLEAGATPEDGRADLQRQLDRLESELSQVRADSGQRGRHLVSLQGDLEELRAIDTERRAATEGLSEQLAWLAESQAHGSRFIEQLQVVANRVEVLEARVDALSDAVSAHQAALSLAAAAGVSGAEGPAPSAVREPAVDPARVARVEEVRRLLLAPEPDLRFDGIDRVEDGRLDELLPEVSKLLGDEDLFVRLHAMIVLGNFSYEEAVVPLFDTLADGNVAVRKQAAETLVSLTGYDPGFDAKGSAAERNRSTQAWREWWAAR